MMGQGPMHNNLAYPLLKRFVAEGLVTQKEVRGLRGQTRKLYALTAQGRRTLIERLSKYDHADAAKPEEFLVRVGLFGLLPPEVCADILATQEDILRERDGRLAHLQESIDLGYFGGDIVRHLREVFSLELSWVGHLRQMLNKERGKKK